MTLEYGRALAHETADGVCDFWMTDLECTVDDELQGALDSVGEEESLFWNLMNRMLVQSCRRYCCCPRRRL